MFVYVSSLQRTRFQEISISGKEEWLQEIEEQTLEELLSLGQTNTTELFDDPTSIITEIDYTTQH